MTRYIYDGQNIIQDYSYASETYTLKAEYVHGIGIDNVLRMDYNDGETTEDYYYHKDGMGSTSEITDDDGALVQAYEYDGWGNVTIYDPSSEIPNSFLYTGREWDSEIGFYYYRARHYAPQVGRFLQVDPLKITNFANLYIYILNNPAAFTDPSGLKRVPVRQVYHTDYPGLIAPKLREMYVDVPDNSVEKYGEDGNAATFGCKLGSLYTCDQIQWGSGTRQPIDLTCSFNGNIKKRLVAWHYTSRYAYAGIPIVFGVASGDDVGYIIGFTPYWFPTMRIYLILKEFSCVYKYDGYCHRGGKRTWCGKFEKHCKEWEYSFEDVENRVFAGLYAGTPIEDEGVFGNRPEPLLNNEIYDWKLEYGSWNPVFSPSVPFQQYNCNSVGDWF